MNKVILIGRIANDIEIKNIGNNTAVTKIVLATERRYKDKNKEKVTDFITCQVWQQTAENLFKYAKKGDRILVEGEIQTNIYETENKEKKYISYINVDRLDYLFNKHIEN